MLDYETFQFQDIGNALGLKLKQGTNTCPICNHAGCFQIKGNYGRCYRPSCGFQGTPLDLLRALGFAKDNQEVYRWLARHNILNLDEWWRRVQFLEQFYAQTQQFRHLGAEYLRQRGLHRYANQGSYGFCPEGWRPVAELKDLRDCGLIDERGQFTFTNRVVFPVYSPKGRLIHLQGRSIDPSIELRWRATTSHHCAPINSYLFSTDPQVDSNSLKNLDLIFLCEGVTDALSLYELELPALASFGLEPRLINYTPLMAKAQALVAIYDADMMQRGPEKLYKSWHRILIHLTNLGLQTEMRDKIFCVVPPENDLNDWLLKGLTRTHFLEYVEQNAIPLPEAVDSMAEPKLRSNLLVQLFQNDYSGARELVLADVERILLGLQL